MTTIHGWEGGVLRTCGLGATSERTTCSLLVHCFLGLLRVRRNLLTLCVVFLQPCLPCSPFFFFIQVALLRDSTSGLIELIHLRRASGRLEQNEYRHRSLGERIRGNGLSLANSCQDMLYTFSPSCPCHVSSCSNSFTWPSIRDTPPLRAKACSFIILP